MEKQDKIQVERILSTRDRNLAEFICDLIDRNKYQSLDITTGYLYSSGWKKLVPDFKKLKIRTIAGVWEGGKPKGDATTKKLLAKTSFLPIGKRQGANEVKVLNDPQRSLHSKLFILHNSENGEGSLAIIGSSNFTGPGLGIEDNDQRKNLELNYLITDKNDIEELLLDFKDLWSKSVNGNQIEWNVITNTGTAPRKTEFSQLIPGILTYRDTIERIINVRFDKNFKDYGHESESHRLKTFQIDAVNAIEVNLNEHGICYLSDDVGLGKTHVGTALIKRYLFNEKKNQEEDLFPRVLVVCPKDLIKSWGKRLEEMGKEFGEYNPMDSHVQLITYGQEFSTKWVEIKRQISDKISLIVIDEAHKLRNHQTQISQQIQEIVGELKNKNINPRFLLITATPINNTFMDLYNTLEIALTRQFWSRHKISNIQELLKHLDQSFNEINSDVKIENNLNKLKKVLSEIMIRRDFKGLKENYPNLKEKDLGYPSVNQKRISGKTISLNKYSTILVQMVKNIDFFTYSYALILNRNDRESKESQEIRNSGKGFLQNYLGKRMQSSFEAAWDTLKNIIRNSEAIIEKGNLNSLTDFLEENEGEGSFGQILNPNNPESSIDEAFKNIKVICKEDIKKMGILLKMLEKIKDEIDQEKADFLIEKIKFHEKGPPVIIFTESRITAVWLIKYFKEKKFNIFDYDFKDLESVNSKKFDQLNKLDPESSSLEKYYKENPDKKKVYILTDRFAEGKNFQIADTVVNYDIPWNPIKKTQRQGRVARLNSKHESVFLYTVEYTNHELKKLANLDLVTAKLQIISSVLGQGYNKDLNPKGTEFITYNFLRQGQNYLGQNNTFEKGIDNIGFNLSGWVENLVFQIKEGEYEKKAKEIIKTFAEHLKNREALAFLDETNIFFGNVKIFNNSRTNDIDWDLQWHVLENGSPKEINLYDNEFKIESRGILEHQGLLEEERLQQQFIQAPDLRINQIYQEISQFLGTAGIKRNNYNKLLQTLKDSRELISKLEFESIFTRLKESKNLGSQQLLDCIKGEEKRLSEGVPNFDPKVIYLYSGAYKKKKESNS